MCVIPCLTAHGRIRQGYTCFSEGFINIIRGQRFMTALTYVAASSFLFIDSISLPVIIYYDYSTLSVILGNTAIRVCISVVSENPGQSLKWHEYPVHFGEPEPLQGQKLARCTKAQPDAGTLTIGPPLRRLAFC